ncbi:MAG: hypothetical protein KAT09_02255 [Candidatus Aegiribacteria sp.]|nr:hypothetical protein [Candidatus Aegiribacteria sp.]
MKLPGLLITLVTLTFTSQSSEVLFSDDFSSGELESNWILYGDPLPRILDSLGLTPPCFNNNGDSMYGSGVVSREIFLIYEGIGVKCDMYMSCSERGTWVTALLSFITPGYRDDRTRNDYQIALIDYSYSGELDWGCPHRQGILKFSSFQDYNNQTIITHYHQNRYLNDWHSYSLEITEGRRVHYFIDDSLVLISPVPIPDTIEHVRIQLGNRSSNWGIALHDNLVVYRP